MLTILLQLSKYVRTYVKRLTEKKLFRKEARNFIIECFINKIKVKIPTK